MWIARRFVAPRHLVEAYAGEIERARSEISAMQQGQQGFGYRVQVRARHVEFAFADGLLAGRVSVADVLRLAGRAATRGAVDRLTAALEHRGALIREREQRFGQTYWQRPREVQATPEYADWSRRYGGAEREVADAAAAWWDGPPGEQLDLFGAAS